MTSNEDESDKLKDAKKFEQHIYHNNITYNITYNNINQFNQNIRELLSKRTPEQLNFLKKYDKDENLKQIFGRTATSEEDIPTISTYLRSICTINIPGQNGVAHGTGFLALVPQRGICFISAGHVLKNVLNAEARNTNGELEKCIIMFGNIYGTLTMAPSGGFGVQTPMSLKAFLDIFGFLLNIAVQIIMQYK